MQVEGVRAACRIDIGGEGDLDGRVLREGVDTAGRKEVLSRLRTAQDLKEHGDGWRDKGSVVHEEVCGVESKDHVERQVYAALHGSARLHDT